MNSVNLCSIKSYIKTMNQQEKCLKVIGDLCAVHGEIPVYGEIAEGNNYCYLYNNKNPTRTRRGKGKSKARMLEQVPNALYWAECNISTPQKVLSIIVIMMALNYSSDLILEKVKYIIFP